MSEKIYDDEVGPLLIQVRDLCAKHKMNFVAAVQYGRDEWAYSVSFENTDNAEYPILGNLRNMYYFAQTQNFDSSLNGSIQDARKYGHSSMYLKMLGVETSPK